MTTALVVLANGFEEIEATVPIDLLRRACVRVVVAGLTGIDVRGSHDIGYAADVLFGRHPADIDALVLPGGQPGAGNLAASPEVIALVKNTFAAGKLCAAICAAPIIFDKAGILAGKKYTCFPTAEKQIRSGTLQPVAVVRDANVVTGRSAGTAIPFSLAIIDFLCGTSTAQKIADTIVYAWTQAPTSI